MEKITIAIIAFIMVMTVCAVCFGDEIPDDKWMITFYCACEICCQEYSDGYFASGRRVHLGGVACNVLPFNTDIYIEGLGLFTVQDRGAKSLFDNKKHIDVYMDDHDQALQMGVMYRNVVVFPEEEL